MSRLDCLTIQNLNATLGFVSDGTKDVSFVVQNFQKWFNPICRLNNQQSITIVDEKYEINSSAVLSLSFYLSTLRVAAAFGAGSEIIDIQSVEFVQQLVDEILPDVLCSVAKDIAFNRTRINTNKPENDALFFYLPQLIGLIYQENPEGATDSIVTFLGSQCEYLEFDAIGYEALLNQLQQHSKLNDEETVIELSYRVNKDMEMSHFATLDHQYKERFVRMKETLDLSIQHIFDSWKKNLLEGKDYAAILKCAKRYDRAFTYHLSYLIEVLYRTQPSQPEVIVNFIHNLRYIRQYIIGYDVLFQEMVKSNQNHRQPCIILLFYRCQQCQQMSNYANVDIYYKNQMEALMKKLDSEVRVVMKSWAKTIVSASSNNKKREIIYQFSVDFSNAFKLCLAELIKSCCDDEPVKLNRILIFVSNISSVNQRLIGYDTLFKIMKERNSFKCLKQLLKLLDQMVRSTDFSVMEPMHQDRLECLITEVDKLHQGKLEQKVTIARKMYDFYKY